jgi:hypothetical protein
MDHSNDIAYALATECKLTAQLRAENERLKGDIAVLIKESDASLNAVCNQRDSLRAEVARLKAASHCGTCDGSSVVDSGGVTPWNAPIDIACPECKAKHDAAVVQGLEIAAKLMCVYCEAEWPVKLINGTLFHFHVSPEDRSICRAKIIHDEIAKRQQNWSHMPSGPAQPVGWDVKDEKYTAEIEMPKLHLRFKNSRKCKNCGIMIWPEKVGQEPPWTDSLALWTIAPHHC